MELYSTSDPQLRPSVVMLVYGAGGVGKTTFAASAPRPILADCENGAKYLGLRGIVMDVADIQTWSDMREFLELARSDKYDTVIIDPLDELMDKLKRAMVAQNDSKLVQKDGSPTMAGWGWLKKTLRDYIKVLRDSRKHILIVAHIDELKDEDKIIKRPKVETKLSSDIVDMVDIVGYMSVIERDGETKRVIFVDPDTDKYVAKDRTGQLGAVIPPDFKLIIKASQGTEKYSWSKSPTKSEARRMEEQKKSAKEKEPEAPVTRKAKVDEALAKAKSKTPVAAAPKKEGAEESEGLWN